MQIGEDLTSEERDVLRSGCRPDWQAVQRRARRGVGSSEPLVGTGRDDATDVLDRRVEFDPYACGAEVRADAAPAP